MNSEIEQRIVAMYFDNKDFEKNAQQTIGTLGQLKESLNLEDSVKGFDELDKAGKKLNLNQARTSVNNLKNSLSGLGSVIQKAFNIGTAPLHALDNFFNTFRGYVGKFVGFDLASKFVNSLESAIQQLTVAPIQAGWNMYQANIDSTKTIMSGTMKSYKEQMSAVNSDWTYSEAEHMEFVKGKLKDLSNYAAKTVFSLQDMTSNVGKFTNQNIDLETSVTAMKGIANMTAKAGQGAQQASMAMYNFSQALGVGKMTTLDWKSIENANIATTELKDMFIMTAAAAGKLQKEVEKIDGKEVEKFFITVDKNGKKLAKDKWMEVSAENFRETLQQGWLDKDTMLHVMQLYSNEGFDLDTLAAWGFDIKDTELMEQLKAVGEEAMLAATQVRTFSKMWDALTESVQSSWADSMELIFGDMTEATEFWTTINDKIGGIMDKIGEERNNILREWRGETWDENTQAWIKLDNAIDGREDLIQGIYGIIDAAKSLGGAFSSAWASVFGSLTGKKLQEITKGFRDFVDRFKNWLGDMGDSESRISKIRSGLTGVFNVLKIVWEVVKNMFGMLKAVAKPLIDPILKLFDKFGKWLNLDKVKNLGDMLGVLRERFTQLWNKISGLGWGGVLGKIGEWFGNLWSQIREGLSNFMEENGLGGIRDWFVNLGDSIKAGYDAVVEWWNSDENKISAFFKGIWETVTSWFQTSYDDKGNEVRSPIVQFFYRIKSGVSEAFESVKTWWEGSGIPKFFQDIWNSISKIFQPKMTGVHYDSTGRHEEYGNSPFVQFFVDILEGLKSGYNTVVEWWNNDENVISGFFKGIWETVTSWFKVSYDDRGNEVRSPIVQFFYRIKSGVSEAFESVKTWWEGSGIPKFFEDLWNSITKVFQPKMTGVHYDSTGRHEEYGNLPIVQFFIDLWGSIQDIWGKVVGWFEESGISEFLSNIWNWIETQAGVVIDWFSMPVNDGKTGFVLFLEEFAASVSSIWTTITGWPGWAEIGKFFGNIWGYITSFFGGGASAAESAESITEVANSVKGTQGPTEESVSLLERIINAVVGFVQNVIDKVQGVVIPPEVNTFFVNVGDFLQGIITFLSDMLGKIGRVAMGKGDFFSDWLPVIAIAVIGIVSKIIEYLNAKHLSGVSVESAASKFMSIGVGLLAIAAAISLLTTVDTDKMLIAAGVMVVLGLIIGKIISSVTTATNSMADLSKVKSTPVTTTERIINNLIDGIEKVGMIAVAMALLPEIIRQFGEAKKMSPELVGKDIMDTLTGLTVMIVGISAVLAVLDKVTAHAGLDPVVALKTGLAIAAFFGSLITGFAVIGGAIGLGASLSDQIQGAAPGSSAKSVQKSLADAGDTIKSIMGVARSFVEGLFGIETDGEKINNAQEILVGLAEQLEVFTSEKTSGLLRVLNLIGTLSQIVQNTPDANKISAFADSLAPLADGIAKFSFIMSGFTDENLQEFAYWNPENLEDQVQKVEGVFRALSHIDGSLSQTHAEQFLNGIRYLNENMNAEDFQAFGHIVNGIVQSFNASIQTDSGPMADMADALMENLSKAIKLGLSNNSLDAIGAFDATPIVDSIVTAIGLGETAIAEAVHNMVQAGLDKSENAGGNGEGYDFDLTQVWEGGLGGLMGFINNPEQIFGSGVDSSGLTDYLYGQGGTSDNPSKGSLFGQLVGFKDEMESFEFPDMSTKLTEAMSLTDENGQAIDLVGNLRETLTSFETELNETTTFEIRIVPTYDFSNLNAETLQAMLKDYPLRVPLGQGGYNIPEMVKVDFAGITSELDINGLKSRLDNINSSVSAGGAATVAAIQAMGAHIDRISYAISQIQLSVDMSGMIPVIDKELGKRAANSSATGVSSMLANPYANLKNIDLPQ